MRSPGGATSIRNSGSARLSIACCLLVACLLSGCVVGPNYHRPDAPVPVAYKEPAPTGWKDAAPADNISKGSWWEIFHDEDLDALEKQAVASNQNLKAAFYAVEQARAQARVSKANFYPAVTLQPSVTRTRLSGTRALSGPIPATPFTSNSFNIPFDATYEPDLFGAVRRSFENAQDTAQATLAAYANTLLVLESDVAQDYFYIRYIDAQRGVLRQNIVEQGKALNLARVRHNGGVASGLDVAQAETLLDTTQAQLVGMEMQRQQYEHALAVMVGEPASQFSVADEPLRDSPPVIPVGVPSELLERRPDIAQAERTMAAQNANIGVARAAFFPTVTLTASGGYSTGLISKLVNLPSLAWSLGAAASQPIFEGGRLKAGLEVAQAAYDQSVANYRQQVLVAFQEVEDGLSGLRVLEQQQAAQQQAIQSARKTLDISTARYKQGLANYLEVIDAQRTVLDNEESSAQVGGLRLLTSVQLIKALGGGWQDSPIK